MTIKPDFWIDNQVALRGMIVPFESVQVREISSEPAISFGLSSYGYDMRVADEFKVFTNVHNAIVDPKHLPDSAFVSVKGDSVLIPPNSFALARSVERFEIPDNVMMLVIGKSTYARCGVIVNCTPAEPGWKGHLTIEISNTTPLPAKIYANEGIAQCLFFESNQQCRTTYADRQGKYQDQGAEIVTPRL